MTLAEFLLARIAEDEQIAREAPPSPWDLDTDRCCVGHSGHPAKYLGGGNAAEMTDAAEHIAHWDPARVLAECDAKRRIVGMCAEDAALAMNYRTAVKATTSEWDLLSLARDTLKTLALPYADHPDYREEWKP